MNVTRDKDISATSIPIQTTNALAKELQTEGENKLIKQQKTLENQVVHYSNLGINKSIESISPSLQQNNSETPDQLPLFVTLKKKERVLRISFLLKVYILLIVQVVMTIGLVCLSFITSLRKWVHDKVIVVYVVIGVSCFFIFFLGCFRSICKKVPLNYICFFTWTILESYMLIALGSRTNYKVIIGCVGILLGLSFGLLVYVLYSYKDYVYCCAFAFSLIGMIVFYIIFAGIFGKWKILAYCLCGFVLVNLYFCYDSTLILRRFHFQYKSNDQIIASVGLYCDVIDVAFNVLSLVNAK